MRLKNPGVSDEKLLQTAGGTLENSVKVLKDNYQIAMDIEMRTLSFAEVKKEIDAGGIIQIDVYDSESEEAIGTGDNLGHALTIVGYVMPKEGNQAPYYIIWNPWWDSTFYLSSNAKTMTLGGTKYEWKRTWHNWRKITNTRSVRVLDKSLKEQKVASSITPMYKKNSLHFNLDSKIFLNQKILEFGNSNLNQNVSQYGKPQSILDVFKTGNSYWYSYRNDNKMIQLGINQAATEQENRNNNGAGRFIQDFEKLSSLQLVLGKSGGFSLPVSSMAVIMALASGGILTQPALKAIGTVLAIFGLKADPATFANQVREYSATIEALNSDFYDVCRRR